MLADTVIVTATNRLARHLQLDHARAMREAGKEAWETPAIFSWQAWLASLFDEVAMTGRLDAPLLLTAAQARALWRDVVCRSEAGAGLMRPARAVARVSRAREQLNDFRVPLDEVDPGDSPDVAAFREWAAAFAGRCEANGWLDPGSLANWLAEALAAGPTGLPGRVRFAGFDDITPAREALIRSLEAGGVTLESQPFPDRGGNASRLACPDAAHEVEAAAAQARRWLEADPGARIGIVVPALEARRAALARKLESELTPGARRSPQFPADPPYNLSLGTPVKSVGLVADALAALALMRGSLPWETAGRLLRSPYFAGYDAERGARARMDAQLRASGARRWSLAALERSAEACGAGRWRTALQRCRRLLDGGMGAASAGAWSERMGKWLAALGWCRGGTLNSRDYQAQQAWFDLLREFARLSPVSGPMDAATARQMLGELAAETPFQPRTGAAPVQVLGLLEAAGLEFDHLWVMGLSDDAWPRPPAPNPFLPLDLQRRHGMPHASADRELAWAERVTRRLITSAPEVVLSWPRREGDAELAPSPLLPADAPEHHAEAVEGELKRWRRDDLVVAAPDRAPPPVPAGEVAGGSGLLTDQAACPFRAFASRRLDADPLEQPGIALDARARGSLVHESLRAFWGLVRSRGELESLDGETRKARARQAVAAARRELEGRLPAQEEAFWALEEARLVRLLTVWLDVELERDDFSVLAREEGASLTLAGLSLSLQVDRRDRLDDGREVIIDYKTGTTGNSPKAWLGERPDQPQLPSYALAMDDPGRLTGLAFAHVRPRDPNLKGVVERDGEVVRFPKAGKWAERPERCARMTDLAGYWRERLENLAAGFRDGISHTDPHYRQVCTHCHRQVLCRVREIRMFWDTGEVGDGDD